jgi:hypothetical protein
LKSVVGSCDRGAVAGHAIGHAAAWPVLFGVAGGARQRTVITFVGIYFAAQPYTYIDGRRWSKRSARGRAVLDEIRATLSKWLFGKLLSMLVVGAATAFGLWMLGVPLA